MNETQCSTSCTVYLLTEESIKRIEDILELQVKRIDSKLDTHIQHATQMATSECERVNAVREMDNKAYNSALSQASEHRLAISNRMSGINDNLRALVSATEDIICKQLDQGMDRLSDRITMLERTQYQTQGKDQTSKSVLAFVAALIGAVLAMGLQRFFFK